jgi:plastocyanin
MATIIPVNVQSEDSSKPRGFSPQTVNAQVGDAVFWHNDDKTTQHQPTPDPAKPAFWGPPIPGQNSSSQINLNVAGTITYQDALQSKLTGTIVVATPVQIGQQFGGGAAFSPSPVKIKAGTAVSWTNADSQPHQPAPTGGAANAWLTQPIPPGQKSPPVAKFPTAGTFAYEDALNKTIQGVIEVS